MGAGFDLFTTLGLRYAGQTKREHSGAAIVKYEQACVGCLAVLPVGGLVVLRWGGEHRVRAFCVQCALERGYAKREGMEPAVIVPGSKPDTRSPSDKRRAYEAWKASGGLGATLPAIVAS